MDLFAFRRRWLLPLAFFQAYLAGTLVLFFRGPWPWEVDRPGQLAGYLLLAQLGILVGYLCAWRSVQPLYARAQAGEAGTEFGLRILHWALIATLVLLVPTSLSRTGSVVPDVLGALADPGAAYNENQRRLAESNPFVVVEYLRMLLSPLLLAVFPLTVVYWGRLEWGRRLAALAAIGVSLAFYIATGTNKGIADFVITLPWMIYLAAFSLHRRVRVNWALAGGAALILLVGFLQFFGAGQAQREGGVGELGVFETGDGRGIMSADPRHPVSSRLDDDQRIIFESLARYLGQGYYALSMSLDLETPSTWGAGHSMFLARNANAVFDTDHFTSASVPAVLEERTGWGVEALWHSIYPWLASDVGFAGALLLMAVFAWLLGLAWGHAMLTKDPWWIVFAWLLLLLFFYVPANNQVFQTGETCVAFFLLAGILVARSRTTAGEDTSPPLQEEAAT